MNNSLTLKLSKQITALTCSFDKLSKFYGQEKSIEEKTAGFDFYEKFDKLQETINKSELSSYNKKKQLKNIFFKVSQIMKIPVSEIKENKTRERKYVLSRQLITSIYFLCYQQNVSLTEVAKIFDQNHATVLHSIKTIKALYATDKTFRNRFSELFAMAEDINYKFSLDE